MSFLKKHWRFTVPAVVVLSTLLIGVVVLYSTSESPEPKTVYTMPEPNPARAEMLKHASLSPQKANVHRKTDTISYLPEKPGQSTTLSEATAELLPDEECCPEESLIEISGDISFEEQYVAWKLALEDYTAKAKANMDASLAQDNEILATALSLLSFASSEERRQIIDGLGELEPELQKHLDNIPPRPPLGVTLEQMLEELHTLLTEPTNIYSESELTQPFIDFGIE